MRILIIGSGGREHALAWRLSQSPAVSEIFASPGNPGIAELGTCIPAPAEVAGYAEIATRFGADLTIVGPEAPLVAGVVDHFRARGLKVIGPTQSAARLEGSKRFAKEFFRRAGIPTARSASSVSELSFPIVVKADGLAAGKGVVIAQNQKEAEDAIARLGPGLVLEEFLEGEEVSFIGLSNGRELVPFTPTQDHKRLRDDDEGPNTGGMGAYADRRILTPAQTGEIMDRIMLPTLAQMAKEGSPFTGFLYAGLMMTAEGPKVLEFNVRLGDPETQALMYSYPGDLVEILEPAANGERMPAPAQPASCSTCIVLASAGYPDQPQTGDLIQGLDEAEAAGAVVFQAGTQQIGERLVTNGGRVLGVTAGGETLQQAIDAAYAAAHRIHFDGMQYRTDIGRKGLRRW
ncbi:MAG TPA: phosphoribosylamine--glycine ligase [Bryobacteraceae bacterium]|jgi:phosphoribosylamine--glycine ligase|nr:phosphoribosylamine--glycine ligase [Bryobacteraceae bacterium]